MTGRLLQEVMIFLFEKSCCHDEVIAVSDESMAKWRIGLVVAMGCGFLSPFIP